MTRTAHETASFLAAHAAPLPAHVTRESVLATLHAMPAMAARASSIAPNAKHESHHDSEGRALFTVTRPGVLDREGLYQIHLCDGRLVAAFARVPTIAGAFKEVAAYLASTMPRDADPVAEAESYRESFRENWGNESQYAMFRASALTRAARWAFRLAAAEAEAKARAEAAAPAPLAEGDCLCLECGKAFGMGPHDVQICPLCYPAERAKAEAAAPALTPAPEPFRAPCKGEVGYTEPAPLRIKLEGRKGLDQLEAEDAAAKAEARAQRKGLDQLEAEAAAPAEVVDVTPTWTAVARIIELGLTHGNATGRQIAREELGRMAAIADSAVAAAKAEAAPARTRQGDAAEYVAQNMARHAVRDCLGSDFTAPADSVQTYATDSGTLNCRASFDGDSVRVAWDCDGRPMSRASAETLIRARMARVTQGL